MNQLVSISIMITCIIAGAATFYMMKYQKGKMQIKSSVKKLSAQDFVNVKDIHDQLLYTRDNQIIAYLKINPISIELFSDDEKKQICSVLTAELSSIQKPFKFLAVSRPVDISPLVNEYTNLLSQTSNQKQKELLRNEIMVMSNYAMSGEVIERQFYIMLWSRYEQVAEREFLKGCQEIVSKFESANISCHIIDEKEIVRLCNLVNNPAYTHMEEMDFESAWTMISR